MNISDFFEIILMFNIIGIIVYFGEYGMVLLYKIG